MADDIDLTTIGRRLRFLRGRKELTRKDAMEQLQDIRNRNGRRAVNKRTFYSHESDERRPVEEDIEDYAELYDASPAFIRYGLHVIPSDGRAPLVPLNSTAFSINHNLQSVDTQSLRNFPVRDIVILSTGALKELKNWTGDLTAMSGDRIPVPDMPEDARSIFSYKIPDHDLSMVGSAGATFAPGTFLVIDGGSIVRPGDYVLAQIPGHEDLLFRIFEADRPFGPDMGFTLRALNPNYQPITVPRGTRGVKIGAVIFFAGRPRRA